MTEFQIYAAITKAGELLLVPQTDLAAYALSEWEHTHIADDIFRNGKIIIDYGSELDADGEELPF